MRKIAFIMALLYAVAFPLYAQNWTSQDSLRLQRFLDKEGEVKLNPEALKELEINVFPSTPKMVTDKPWMDFDLTLPASLPGEPKKKMVLTLQPYKAGTKYNWDPIYQKKIRIDENTWRGDEFYELKILTIPTNWAKRPSDPGPRETVEQIEATGMRYMVTERANNVAVGGWQRTPRSPSGMDLMKPFTREFWDFKGRKRRARTLEILSTYGDSTTVSIKHPIKQISK